jgi:hypothetical protein
MADWVREAVCAALTANKREEDNMYESTERNQR